jgi:putative PIN family toxin of toxin-antitoxin system
MRVVPDTNILVRANAKAKGPARELLQVIVNSPEHVLLVSPFLLMELERVLSYDRVRAVVKLNDEEIAEYLGNLRAEAVSEIVFPGPAPSVVPSDPDDDPVVHTAVAGPADVLCTSNRHFFHPSVLGYCQQRGVLAGTDTEMLDFLRSQGPPTVS